jgi:hypothetical protein
MTANNGIEAWRTDLGQVLESAPLTVTDVRIGVFYTAALLSSGHTGVAFTPRDLSDTVCCPRSAAAAPPSGHLAGPTASPWPPTFFARGVHVLGGIRVLDGPRMLQIVSEGGSGYFFQREAEKVSVVRNGTG